MKQKPLIETNPYLRDPEKFRKALITNVTSSTAIETGAPVASIVRMLEEGVRIRDLFRPLVTQFSNHPHATQQLRKACLAGCVARQLAGKR
jgi:hypothetical protein